jgi:Uma2 family endonuclease
MPKTRHSIFQKRLIAAIDDHSKTYTALPELRCTFGERSVVPDIAIVAWDQIEVNEAGEPKDNFTAPPDWAVEILLPEQKANRVIDNLLHCLRHGCQLGWLIDPDDRSILILTAKQELQLCRGNDALPVLDGSELTLTADQVFEWLKIRKG